MSHYYLISLLADRATDRPDKRQLLHKFSLKSFIKKKIFLSCFNGRISFFSACPLLIYEACSCICTIILLASRRARRTF